MNARWLALACSLAGCDKLFSLDRVADAGAAGDGAVITDAEICVGQTGDLLRVCFATLPPATLDLTGGTFDTDTDPRCLARTDVCVLAAVEIMVTGDVRATGLRPLVLVATDQITIAFGGTVDVSSASTIGAGAAMCASPAGPQQTGTTPGGGGAGGTFGDVGGDGGAASGKAIASPVQSITSVRGGCAGGAGGADAGGDVGGAGGAGGGAIALIAGNQIAIQGDVAADGAGGAGGNGGSPGNDYKGAGGGGSGGLIALDAPAIIIDSAAILVANGGGGGEGESPMANGEAGSDPDATAPDARAPGGMAFGGGDGGEGSAGQGETTGLPGTYFTGRGGGGGGGGAGIILVTPFMTLNGQDDPPPT